MINECENIEDIMDNISPTYCAAKWLNSTIWLYCGETASCHHVKADKICLSDLMVDLSSMHNTPKKIKARRDMLQGKMPEECEYCWAIEKTSCYKGDRLYKTGEFDKESIEETLTNVEKIFPKYLEIAFDDLCNFACCYCTSKYSSRWKSLSKDKVSVPKNKSVFVYFFWKWFPTLIERKTTLRITGGEPLLHSEFWRLLDIYEKEKIQTPIMVNTNLGSSEELISRLINKSKNIKDISIHTSCEAIGDKAEYIRDGLNFKIFEKNLINSINSKSFKVINITATLTNLSVCYYVDFLNWLLNIKKNHNGIPTVNTNILHYPPEMGVRVLSEKLKKEIISDLEEWMALNKENKLFNSIEIEGIDKLIFYLKSEKENEKKEYQIDKFKSFFKNYDDVRNKKILEVFPKIGVLYEDNVLQKD